ncbi:MAG: FliM/FliN family flagellar motor switch protein [Candidatus Latescibacteria bacterium]|nr:FliM/FliN family flagellar motor switch protein [Candidatus Latescibacterota bacterium]
MAENDITDTGDAVREAANVRHLADAELDVVVELGRATISVREASTLGAQSVIRLNIVAGEVCSIRINGCLFAEGEVVLVRHRMGCRVTRLMGLL